jgi:DNA-binding CsgD family transcriptional regulator
VIATRSLSIVVTEALYLKLVERARSQGHTPTVYAKLLLEAAWSARQGPTGDAALDRAVASLDQPVPKNTEGEAMQAMATKGLQRELDAVKAELRQMEEYYDKAKQQLGVWQAETVELQEQVNEHKRLYKLLSDHIEDLDRQRSNLIYQLRTTAADRDEAIRAAQERAAADPALQEQVTEEATPPPAQPAKAPGPEQQLSASQIKRARAYLNSGMSADDVASIMSCSVETIKAAIGSKV